jgi:DNA segregation ATPase FtsK/SpoIIIE, S-DNA-T family
VLWSTIRDQLPKAGPGGASSFPVGIAVDGAVRWADFSRPEHSHFLVAGTAGSGKSEWLRAMLASLLASNGRATLRLALIDPKRVGFGTFEGRSCLWRPMAYAPDEAIQLLDALVREMEDRYSRLAEAGGVQDVKALAEQGDEVLARIVCACDEYADLLAEKGTRREIESRVARLAQKGRAAGIHLVFATQRPSRDVVTGVIKANLMARVALKVAAPLESRLIVDNGGAAALLGRGDLLFKDLGDPVRLQSPYVKDDELRHLLKSFAPIQT